MHHATFFVSVFLMALPGTLPAQSSTILTESKLIDNIRAFYPPYLISLIKQDLAGAGMRKAIGGFDPILSIQGSSGLKDYYDGHSFEFLLTRPMRNSGGSVYGGYRLSEGFLPSYKRDIRTGGFGEAVLGIQFPLLRNLEYDNRRANLDKAQITLELVKPSIALTYLGILEAARKAYYTWRISGQQLQATQELLQLTSQRQQSLALEVSSGAQPAIILTDNKRLLVERKLQKNAALLRHENASLQLSLFYRTPESGQKIQLLDTPSEALLLDLTKLFPPSDTQRDQHIQYMFRHHPAIHQLQLIIRKLKIDLQLAQNNKKPDLKFVLEFNQNLDRGSIPKDIEESELKAMLKFTVPLGRNEAKGQIKKTRSKIRQLYQELAFLKEQLTVAVETAHNSIQNNHQNLELAQLNEELANTLFLAEQEKFHLGASTLLELQLREKTLYTAKILSQKYLLQYYHSKADYLRSTGQDL